MENYTTMPSGDKVPSGERLRTYTNTQSGHSVSALASPLIGVDTVHLTLSSTFATFLPHFKAVVSLVANSDGTMDKNPCVLWTDTEGRPAFGNKAVINTPNWQLTVVPCGNYANVLISTSAKAFAENNVETMDADRLRYVIQSIQNELKERGLICNLFNEAHVRRLDVARNANLLHASNAYVGLFRNYTVHSKLRPASDGDTYFRLGAAGWQTVIYDKGQEQAEKSATRKRRLPPTNKLRGEIRFLTSKETGKRFDVKKLHLSALLKPERFAQLPEMYRETMRASMFESERAPHDAMSMNNDTAKLWAQVQARVGEMADPGSTEYFRLLCYAMTAGAAGLDGARRWYQENISPDDTEAAKRRRRRFESELKRAGAIFGATETESNGFTRDELYNEMRDALLEE